MSHYSESLTKWFAKGYDEANFGKFSIPSGAIVQIQVGTQKLRVIDRLINLRVPHQYLVV